MDLYSPTWETRRAGSRRRGWKCHHKAGGAGSVTPKQESKPGDTKCHLSTITFSLRQSSQIGTVPPSPPSLFPSLPSCGKDYKNTQRWMQTVGWFIKTNKSIFLRGIIALEPSCCSTELPALFGSLCLLPAISLDYLGDVPLP